MRHAALLPTLLVLAACAGEVKAPVADAGSARRVVTGTVTALDGTASRDPGGLPLSYAWSFLAVPPGSAAALRDPHLASPSFTPDLTGSYDLQLVVSNGTRSSAPAHVSITADPSVGAVVAVAGFTVSAAYAGDTDHLRAPRGIAVKPGGGLYVANGGGTGVAASVSFHQGGTSRVFSPGTYFALTAPQDLAWDAANSRLLASAGRRLVAMGADGVQTAAAESDWTLNGLAWDGTTLLAAEATNRQVLTGLPATPTAIAGLNLALGNGARPWGLAATSASGVQVVFVGQPNNADATVVRFSAGATVAIATDSILSGVRDLVLSPCTTPKLLAAARSTGTIAVLNDCATTGCAGGAALRSLIQGLGNPVGLAFEGSGDTATLWVSDETLNTVFKVTGPFCSL
jgi:hypothetical protein